MASEIFGDMQTTVTAGLIGATAGAVSSRVGHWIAKKVGVGSSGDVGNLALRFAIEALGSSAIYYATSRLAPETVSNTYFSYIYFMSDANLTASTMALADRIVSVLDGFDRSSSKTSSQSMTLRRAGGSQTAAARSHCSTC